MPRALTSLLALTVLICSACTPEAPSPSPAVPSAPPATTAATAPILPAPAPAPPPAIAAAPRTDLRDWWVRDDARARLGLTAAESAAWTTELNRFEQAYQTAQRQLPTIRQTQLRMLQDPAVPSGDIRRFNRQNVQSLLTEMAEQNFAARLWLRDHASAVQRARLLERCPEFFAEPWFRSVRDPS